VSIPLDWQAIAFNTSFDSDNQIHSDAMAKAYGFRGGLVPGVVVSSYLAHPAVEAWGLDWLTRGHAKVIVHKPTYDGDLFNVELSDATGSTYTAHIIDSDGGHNATGNFSLTATAHPPPTLRGDPVIDEHYQPAEASLDVMKRLQDKGMSAVEVKWNEENEMASYLGDSTAIASLHQFTGGGYANAAFMLGLSNWVLAANVHMNPWIHLQTESFNYAPVENNSVLRVECDIQDLFARRGHEFVDLRVDVYLKDTAQAVMTVLLRAIYKMRAVT
jgi:hypothetical protein